MNISKSINVIVLLSLIFPVFLFAKRWEKIETIPHPYDGNYWLDVYFLPSNPDYGWICGFNGRVIRTNDGGETWRGATVAGANHLESVHFPSVNVGYTSGTEGIFKSTNGGQSWFEITPSSNTVSSWGCYFLNEDDGFFVGGGCVNPQQFWRTTDGGNSWNVYVDNAASSGLTDLIVYSMWGDGFASGSGWIWRTTDGGQTWSQWVSTGPSDWQEEITRYGASFCFPTAAGCQGGGANGGIRFTTDNGSTWNYHNLSDKMFGTFLLDANTCWACGYNRNAWYTEDGGQNWEMRNCGVETGNLDDIWFITSERGWVVGEGVYRLADPLQRADRQAVNFDDLCIPGAETASVNIENINFDPDDVSISIVDDPDDEFRIVSPNNDFIIGSCGSEEIEIAFEPKNVGTRSARLRVQFNYGTEVFVNLSGYALEKTAAPEDTLVEINPAYCGSNNYESLNWTADTDRESITEIQRVDGSPTIENRSSMPFDIQSGSVNTVFSAEPIDTGWTEARFRCDFAPCSGDTFITARAYGVSPIITTESSRTVTSKCMLPGIDTIPVYNLGNDDLLITESSIVENNSDFSVLGWDGAQSMPVIVKPDTFASVIIRFVYNQNSEDEATLRLINNDKTKVRGDKDTLDILLYGNSRTTDLICRDTTLDFGKVCLGAEEERRFFMFNEGDLQLEITKPNYDTSIYRVNFDPNEFPAIVKSGDSIRCAIAFEPEEVGPVNDTIVFNSTPCDQALNIIITGEGVNAAMKTDKDNISLELETGRSYVEDIEIRSVGTEDIEVTNVELYPETDAFSISIEPPLPQFLASGGGKDFTIEITALKDTVYDGYICFSAQGYCDCGLCISAYIESVSSNVEADKADISFGYIKCDEGSYYDTLTFTNTGIAADTLIELSVYPSDSPFEIDDSPQLPYELTPGDSTDVVIRFDAFTEGDFSASFTYKTSAGNNVASVIPVSGEYRSATSAPLQRIVDFGEFEQCEAFQTAQIEIYNSGSLKDSIIIAREKNLNGITVVPDDYIVVAPNDTAILDIYLYPTKFTNLGDFSEKIYLNGEVCPVEDSLLVEGRIFHHRFTLTPDTVDFGESYFGDVVEKSFTISNESEWSKDLIYMFIDQSGEEFSFKRSYDFAIPLVPGESMTVPLLFLSNTRGDFTAKVVIYEHSVCMDTSIVYLVASAEEGDFETTVIARRHEAKPGEDISIPIILDSALEKLPLTGLDYEFSFDPRLFMPEAIFVKTGSNRRSRADFSYYDGKITGVLDSANSEYMFKEAGAIMWIEGGMYLSYPDSTDFYIDRFEPRTRFNPTINKIDGELKLIKYCQPIGKMLRLELKGNNFLYIKNNPVIDGQLKINVKTESDNKIFARLWNVPGECVLETNSDLDLGLSELIINVSELPSGVYILKAIFSTGEVQTEKIIIIR